MYVLFFFQPHTHEQQKEIKGGLFLISSEFTGTLGLHTSLPERAFCPPCDLYAFDSLQILPVLVLNTK